MTVWRRFEFNGTGTATFWRKHAAISIRFHATITSGCRHGPPLSEPSDILRVGSASFEGNKYNDGREKKLDKCDVNYNEGPIHDSGGECSLLGAVPTDDNVSLREVTTRRLEGFTEYSIIIAEKAIQMYVLYSVIFATRNCRPIVRERQRYIAGLQNSKFT